MLVSFFIFCYCYARFAQHAAGYLKAMIQCAICLRYWWRDDPGDPRLSQRPRAVGARKSVDVSRAANKSDACSGGVVNSVAFRMFYPMELFTTGSVKAGVIIR